MENEELIREDMERTRESLTEKLETLEDKVLSSVHQATSAVNETVANVKETMHEGVEKVKDAVDIPAHVERQPWLMVGGAMLAGFLVGSVLFGKEKQARQPEEPSPKPPAPRSHGNGHHKRDREKAEPAPKKSSVFQMLDPEIQHLKGLALGVTLGTLREALTAEAPPHLAAQLGQIIDSITEKVGGTPVPSSDLPFAHSSGGASQQPAGFETDVPRW